VKNQVHNQIGGSRGKKIKSLNWNGGLFQIYKERLKLRPKVLLKSKKWTPLDVPTFNIGTTLT
jgi:hypothetical protein